MQVDGYYVVLRSQRTIYETVLDAGQEDGWIYKLGRLDDRRRPEKR